MKFGRIIFSLLLSVSPIVALAQTSEAMPFMSYGHDAASEALAGAGAFNPESQAWAAFDNTAAASLASSGGATALSYHNMASSQSVYYSAAVSFAMGSRIKLSLACSKGDGQKYPIYVGPGSATGQYFTPSESLGAASLGVRILDNLSVGFAASYAIQDLAKKVSYRTPAFSANAAYCLCGYNVALGAFDLGKEVEGYDLPSSVRIDASKTFELGPGDLYVGLRGASYFNSGNYDAALGVSYILTFGRFFVSPKAGARYASDGCVLPSYLTAGCGIGFGHWGADLAYIVSKGPIGSSMLTGIHCNF